MTEEEKNKFYDIVYRVCEEEATEEEYKSLNDYLENSQDARRYYRDFCNMHLDLEEMARKESYEVVENPQVKVISVNFIRLSIAAAIFVALGIAYLLTNQSTPDASHAKLLLVENVVWESKSYRVGEEISSESLKLKSGVAKIKLSQGGVLSLEGPTNLKFTSKNKASLEYGRILAHTPVLNEAFVISTPTVNITDTGTEYGVNVLATGETEVHVFDGQVSIEDKQDRSKEPFSVTSGLAYSEKKNKLIELKLNEFEEIRNSLTNHVFKEDFSNGLNDKSIGWNSLWKFHGKFEDKLSKGIEEVIPFGENLGPYFSMQISNGNKGQENLFQMSRQYDLENTFDSTAPHLVEILVRIESPPEDIMNIHIFDSKQLPFDGNQRSTWKLMASKGEGERLSWKCYNTNLPSSKKYQFLPVEEGIVYRLLVDINPAAKRYRSTVSDGKTTIWNSRMDGDAPFLGHERMVGGYLNISVKTKKDAEPVKVSVDEIRLKNHPDINLAGI